MSTTEAQNTTWYDGSPIEKIRFGRPCSRWKYGYLINFSDGGLPEFSPLGLAESEEECEKIADLIPAVAYSGDRPVESAFIVWLKLREFTSQQ